MSKVVLTKEQAEAIEKWLQPNKVGYAKKDLLEQHSQIFLLNSLSWTDSFKGLRTMSIDEMATALYVGYEIEKPKFEVGQIVVGDSGAIYRIKKDNGETDFIATDLKDNFDKGVSTSKIRHATKKEIYWAELGREVGEFRDGDVIQSKCMLRPYTLKSRQDLLDAKTDYQEKQIKGFYPSESFKSFPKDDES